ncbi:MAG TPA: PHP-associated domain-containing protein [Pseudomonadales bacterium]|nr:PHP-associated domain-containing protein [Pseudomonadales bacterium]
MPIKIDNHFESDCLFFIFSQELTMPNLSVEFHCHTIYSKDSLTRPQDLVNAARKKGIDRVIVTDHNSIGGALEAQAIDPERIIVGEEIMTTKGEILAAFVREEIPAGLTPQETIKRLREQGAFISVSHPFDVMRGGHWKMPDLLEILPLVDAIETFNARCWLRNFNAQALAFARVRNVPGTVGSDAHTTWELGRATLSLAPFSGPEELRAVLPQAQIRARMSSPLIHLTSRYATIVKKLKRQR